CVGGRSRTPAEAVAEAVADQAEEGRRGTGRDGSLGRWLAGLSAGGLGAVRGEATTWATELLCALEWDRLPGATVGPADQWWDGAGVGMRGRADLRVPIIGPGPGDDTEGPSGRPATLLTVVGGWPGPTSRTELGLAALVAALAPIAAGDRPGTAQVTGGVPARVAGWWPECGRAVIAEVDRPLLEATVAAVVGSIRVVVAGG
ncbi:MAG TPA: hypothetical protein VHW47_00745, partial [Acidimicrobiales bacterium]|nr:hypothetical protein [Acidimicrobiales bacterium]